MTSEHAPRVERTDVPTRPPSLVLLGLRIGALSGAIVGVYGAITSWVSHQSVGAALRSWLVLGVETGTAVGVLYPLALVVAAKTRTPPRRIESTRQRCDLRLGCAPHQALALAADLLAAMNTPARHVDLVQGVLRAETEARQPLVGAVRFDVVFSVRPDGDACVLEARTEPKVSPYDLGGARDVLDRVCARFVERFASGALPRDTLPVTAIPKSALALLSSKGSSLGTLRDLQPDAPAALATLYAGNGETRRVLVVLLAFEAGSDLARRAAAKVRAGGAQHARGGPGFVLLPLEDREDARKLARRIARVLHESQPDRGTPAQQALTKNERLPRRDEAATRDERRKR